MLSEMDMPTAELADGYSISRVVKGCWQLSHGHGGDVDSEDAIQGLVGFAQAGITTLDCGDIYLGVEELLGEFRKRCRKVNPELASRIRIQTKYVPDRDCLESVDRASVRAAITGSMSRLGVDRLDMVQLHWWDYGIPRYVEVAAMVGELVREGLIAQLGVTNWNVARLSELVEAGVPIVSHQLQYSVIDQRPERGMVEFCARHGIALLCYGVLAGGLLSDEYLGVQSLPTPPANRSLTKYGLILDEAGGWDCFQALLRVFHSLAIKHQTSVSAIAANYILSRPQVVAIIVGSVQAKRLRDLRDAVTIRLDGEDIRSIQEAMSHLHAIEGDVYDLERIPGGAHASVMRCNLNAERPVR
jgi:aryl-alcohol dehydrogenase-like predicted oxidoreductase